MTHTMFLLSITSAIVCHVPLTQISLTESDKLDRPMVKAVNLIQIVNKQDQQGRNVIQKPPMVGGLLSQPSCSPSQWRNVLDSSKWKFWLWIVISFPFPNRTEYLSETEDCIDESLADHKVKGKCVEAGTL